MSPRGQGVAQKPVLFILCTVCACIFVYTLVRKYTVACVFEI